MKKNKQNKTAKALMFLIFIIVAAGLVGFVVFNNWYNSNVYSSASNSDEVINLSVPEGENFNSILDELKAKDLINDVNAVKLYARFNNLEPSIKAGEYKIKNNVTLKELIEILEKGVTKNSFWITIREGLRDDELTQIVDDGFSKLPDEDVVFDPREFQNIIDSPNSYEFSTEVEAFLNKYKPSDKSLIGFLFPDTYNFETGATSVEVIDAMLVNFVKKINDLDVDIDNISLSSIDTFYEALTLASIIEKESGGNDDRNLIASVFHNRLNSDVAYLNYLQSDATVNYITKANNPRPTIEQTEIDNPYNTYRYPGIPPSPVSNPGIRSILATLKPTSSNYLFFRHDMQANAYFNETYEGHLNSIYWNP